MTPDQLKELRRELAFLTISLDNLQSNKTNRQVAIICTELEKTIAIFSYYLTQLNNA